MPCRSSRPSTTTATCTRGRARARRSTTPRRARVLGVIDLSSGIRASHPHSLALVTAAAQTVEAALREDLAERRERLHAAYLERVTGRDRTPSALLTRTGDVLASTPAGWLPAGVTMPADGGELIVAGGAELVLEPLGDDGSIAWLARAGDRGTRLTLRALGRSRAEAWVDGERLGLSPRHGELLVLLALRPDGLTAEEVALELYGDAAKRVAARAEMSRLRRALGWRLGAKPVPAARRRDRRLPRTREDRPHPPAAAQLQRAGDRRRARPPRRASKPGCRRARRARRPAAASSTSSATSAGALAPLAQHVGGDDLRVGRVRAARRRCARGAKSGEPKPCLQRLQAVVAGQPAAEARADVAERQVDLVVQHEDVVELDLQRAARRARRLCPTSFMNVCGCSSATRGPPDAGAALGEQAR